MRHVALLVTLLSLVGCGGGGLVGNWKYVESFEEPDVVWGGTWLNLRDDGSYDRTNDAGDVVFTEGTWADDGELLSFTVTGGTETTDDWTATWTLGSGMDDAVRRDTLELDRTDPLPGRTNPTLWMRKFPDP